MDVPRLILVDEKGSANFENLMIFHSMILFYILARDNGRILYVEMKARVPFFGRLNDENFKP